ncbi:serine hydrolase domain-containing protein [Sphingomonas mesophila]|uniref:serine hydrolase domain-containing protein n=1 Tax=Sphingomonas mesophila TaxID=2303576 RepID=UPI000E57DF02|nr:serine hydrolase domain-containing protein [Sphingomonas mesophila]
MLRLLIASLALAAAPLAARPLTPAEAAAVDKLVADTLKETGVPAVSIAIVRDNRLAFAKAYGKASDTLGAARPEQPYQIASISKQFTAMAALLLEDDGKLDLDDPVAQWLPGISGGERITLRQLLSHTAGIADYWPQDYSFAAMERPARPGDIIDRWARKPLDYQPGTRWQYSNTGYVVAGQIIEKAAGEPLMALMQRRIFAPLGLTVRSQDDSMTAAFPQGYERAALGPVRPVTWPGRGWMYATGELAMSATDLAKWNIARLTRTGLPGDDWAEQEQPVLRSDGASNGYGLGIYNRRLRDRRIVSHGGAAVGFLTQNAVYPDSRAAITVLTNADFSGASGDLLQGLERIVLSPPDAQVTEGDRLADVRTLYAGLVAGRLDRTRLTENLNYYFNRTRTADYRTSLAPLGTPTITLNGPAILRGGFVNRVYTLKYAKRELSLSTYAEPGANGRWEQFMITP